MLVERVRSFAKGPDWRRAYEEINEFERQLAEHRVIVAKFWLAVSRTEQLERFAERDRNPLKRFKVDPDQRSLVGHSFGGMFGVYALFTRPALFQHVVAVSPSLWWRDRYLMAPERAFIKRAHAGQVDLTHRSLTLLMGERDMVQEIQDARALQLRLQDLSQYGLRSDFQIEAGEDHMSVPFRIPTRVLDELISTRRF